MVNGKKEKPIVFISHASEDKEKVERFRVFLDKKYIGSIEFFSTSDAKSIGGQNFYTVIEEKIKKAKILILYITSNSINKRWLYYEAGGGHYRGIPVIPVCHSDISIKDLPSPLEVLKGFEIKKYEDFKDLIGTLSKTLEYHEPEITKEKYREFCKSMDIKQITLIESEEIKNIYSNCKILLKSDEQKKVISGLQMISIIKPPDAIEIITPYLFSEDFLIRAEARAALTKISPQSPFRTFLEETIKAVRVLNASENIRKDFYMFLLNSSKSGDDKFIDHFIDKNKNEIEPLTQKNLLELKHKIEKKFEMYYSGWRDDLDQFYNQRYL